MWPYLIAKFNIKPSEAYYAEATKHQSVRYKSVPLNLKSIKACLAEGYPVVFGFIAHESFGGAEIEKTGVLVRPKPGEPVLGGHCVAFVGYDDFKMVFICRNSWGPDWGDRGYFTMPYDFALESASDLWQISAIE